MFLLYPTILLAEPSVNVSFTPKKIKQGDILLITVKTKPGTNKISGSIFDRPIHFYADSNRDRYSALIGIDIDTEPERYSLSISIEDKKGRMLKKDYKIKVISARFGTQRLTLPKEMVELDEGTLKRVRFEEEKIRKIWDIFTEDNLWNGNFITPVKGEYSNNFGLRRIINNEPRSSHSGLDVTAPEGTSVYAPNHGKVVFVDDLFFSGKSLVIDHGLGLFTMYFHLSEIFVTVGD
ncbi:MAG: M23 family metallopeptidase, partial [Nitrospinae bacterium]|nr:M23 family metallopeptidase [Nitrospinota bacterium]